MYLGENRRWGAVQMRRLDTLRDPMTKETNIVNVMIIIIIRPGNGVEVRDEQLHGGETTQTGKK